MLKTPMVFTMDELMRLPSVSRFHFIECGANTGMEWGNVAVPTCQYTPRHAQLQRVHRRAAEDRCSTCAASTPSAGRYVLAEGADGSSMTRTIPMEMVESGEVLVAYGQNGEMLRPENGYPLAPGRARRAGRELGQVPAPHRGRRPAVWHQGRGASTMST